MTTFSCRETLLRLAVMRLHKGNPRVLSALLAEVPALAPAVATLPAQRADVRAVLAPLCVDDDALCAMLTEDLRFLAAADARALLDSADDYPALLGEIAGAPPLLFCRGDSAALARPQLAIVGSRNASPAGLALARSFAADLAAGGFVITSGLALGIDAMAHEGALAAGGQTVAVLGSGVDRIYPRRHAELARRVRAQGCIVSELLPGTEPLPAHFPQRNRIISGMALGVLVVEAAPDSGSLITARFAAEQGREVFAIPGSIHSPLSRGCHQLIREGATLIETSAQMIEALAHFARTPAPATADLFAQPADGTPAWSADESCLLAAMSPAGSAIDDLIERTGLAASVASRLLNELLLRGAVHALPGGRWQPAAIAG